MTGIQPIATGFVPTLHGLDTGFTRQFKPSSGGAFPVVQGSLATGDGVYDTSVVLDLPTDITAGELLLLTVRSEVQTIATPAGYSQLGSYSATPPTEYVFAKTAEGDEGTTISLTASGLTVASGVAHRISGWGGTPEILFATNTLDPPELTPSWGSSNTLWLAFASTQRGNVPFTAGPADYSGFVEAGSGFSSSAGHNRIASAHRSLAASSEDPGVFTGGFGIYHALTIAVRPA